MTKVAMDKVGNRMMNRFFRRVEGVVWDLMTGKVGVRTSNGIATLEGEGESAQIVENMFDDFGIELPAFAQNTKVADIKIGDLIFGDNGPKGWVIKTPTKTGVEFTLLKPGGDKTTWRPPKVQSLGLDLGGAMVLRSLINTLPGGTSGLGSMQNMLMPMIMMGGGNLGSGDLEEMLPMILMSQTGVMGDPNGGGNMLQTMLMMKMMNGFKGDGGRPPVPAGVRPGGSYFDRDR